MTTGNVYARPPANTPSTPRSMEESGEAHDYLVCGLCYRNFPLSSIVSFMQHKKLDCDDVQMYPNQVENSRILLQCQTCSQRFFNPWTLLQHAQQDHSLSIYLNVAGLYESVTNSDDGGNASQPFGIVQSALTFSRNSEEQAPSIHNLESKTSSTDRSTSVHDGRRTFSENSDSYVLDDCQQNLESFERGQESSSENEAAEDRDGAVKQAAAKSTILKQKGKLQKCCTAVVPKKRKRHMETKHILTHDKLRLEGSTIYIDVASTSDAFHGDPSPTTEEHHHEKRHGSPFSASEMSTRSAVPTQYNPARKTSSIIIQPGSTFSIPLPYMPRASSIPLSVHAPRPVPLRVACTGGTCPPGADGLSSYTTPNLVCSADQSVLNFSLHDKQQARNQLDYGSLYRPVIGHSGLTDREHSGERLSAFHNPKFPAPTQSSSHQANHDREDCTPTVTVTESRNRSHITHMQDKQKKKRRYPTSRPFKCDQCSQAFNQRIHLRKHLSKHTGIKPFKCEQCDYSTVERSHLKVHIRVHTGEKPFKCTYCEYATAQNSTLKIHLKRHHATNDGNTCSVCNRKFTEQDSLAVHMTQHGYSQQAGNQAHQNFSDQTENSESFASD